ncbi:MAG: hypothetical protein AAGH67_05405 [Cyanobacteria bacterium P01_H01_bin.162]
MASWQNRPPPQQSKKAPQSLKKEGFPVRGMNRPFNRQRRQREIGN